MKKSKDETIGPVKYAPKDRFKNKLVIHSKTGNFVDTERTDIKNGGKMKKRNNRVFEQDTAIKPEKSADRVEKSEVSTLDVDMFENIVRDLGRLSSVAAKMIDDIGSNNAQHYDEYILKLKRIFEPLVVTMQRLPDHKDDLGKEEPEQQDKSAEAPPELPPDAAKNNIASTGGTELDKELDRQKSSGNKPVEDDEEDMKKNLSKNRLSEHNDPNPHEHLSRSLACSECGNPTHEEGHENPGIVSRNLGGNKYYCKECAIKKFGEEKYYEIVDTKELPEGKTSSYVDKVALKTRTGRIVWVKRSKVSQYIAKKGYTIASGAVPRSKKKKSGKPHRAPKKTKLEGTGGLYTGSGTHNIMSQDKQELIDDQVGSRFDSKMPPEARTRELQYMKKAYEDMIKTEGDSYVRKFYEDKLRQVNDEMSKLSRPMNKQTMSTRLIQQNVRKVNEQNNPWTSSMSTYLHAMRTKVNPQTYKELEDKMYQQKFQDRVKNVKVPAQVISAFDTFIRDNFSNDPNKMKELTRALDYAEDRASSTLSAPIQQKSTMGTQQAPMREMADSKRFIMRGPNGKTYAVRASKAKAYIDKGFTLEKDNVTKMPKNLRVDESEFKSIVKEEFDNIVNRVAKKQIKNLRK